MHLILLDRSVILEAQNEYSKSVIRKIKLYYHKIYRERVFKSCSKKFDGHFILNYYTRSIYHYMYHWLNKAKLWKADKTLILKYFIQSENVNCTMCFILLNLKLEHLPRKSRKLMIMIFLLTLNFISLEIFVHLS